MHHFGETLVTLIILFYHHRFGRTYPGPPQEVEGLCQHYQ
uniref:Uncharacterized protein n=1 Tax=uncultured Desulfobacterium sp. TaxID=201089 RepID=E1YEF2_9BACT|nr:unknown protein [uncultured Desulfobacterium sp.]